MQRLKPHFLTISLILIGAIGGGAAQIAGLPLPFLLGSLLATAPIAIFAAQNLPQGYTFPASVRVPFIALIGAVIGAQVTLELMRSLHTLLPSMAAIVLFVAAAQALNYLIFRKIGRYDKPTAFYSGSPGGLIESITLGEASGANAHILITQQFLRIILVISLVPLGLSFYLGHPVGSAGGVRFSSLPVTPIMYPLALLIVGVGMAAGKAINLPAWQLTGALAVSAGFALAGHPLALPNWLVFAAQIIVGASLGMRFAGMRPSLLLKGVWLSLISVGAMFALGAAFAYVLMPYIDQPFDVLFITFAPGGVNEMALVALSLGANPAFVTLHHIFRIVVTVMMLGYCAKRLTFSTEGKN